MSTTPSWSGRANSDALGRRVEAHFKRAVATVRPVAGGYSRAERIVIGWREGGSVFVKGATDADTATWLRAEHAIYARYRASFIPELLGWQDDGVAPWLAIEDLSDASWPPPWSETKIEGVLAAMAEVAACETSDLPSMETHRAEFAGWPMVAAD